LAIHIICQYAQAEFSFFVEVIAIRDINEANERLKKSDVKYPIVIDLVTL
jgi:D-arabinose 1-dehydrogenase-like Zn-dependent alcohol dehydrogenase